MRYRFSDTQSGRVGRKLYAVSELDPRPRILGQEQIAVEVDVVEEARNLRSRRDRETRLVHAAEHHSQPERAARVDDAHRLADAAGLRELHGQAVRALRTGGHVLERVAVLVDVDRERRAALQLGAIGAAGRERLLAVLDTELFQLRQRLERLVQGPVLVHVDLQRDLADSVHGPDALDVEPVSPAELQLEPLEPSFDPLRSPRHVVGIPEPDRPGGRWASALETEELPDGQAGELATEVVQGGVDGCLGRLLPRALLQARAAVALRKKSRACAHATFSGRVLSEDVR